MEHASNSTHAVPDGYAELPPPADLALWVVCFWTRLASAGALAGDDAVHRVLPDGCVDIVLGLGRAGEAGSDVTEAMGVGAMTKPLYVRGRGPRLYIGVRFKPGYAYAALGIPAADVTDTNVSFEAISRNASAELDAIAGAATDGERVALVIDLVRRRMANARAIPAGVRVAVGRIVNARGNLRIASLASDMGVTRQQLARQFTTHVGVSPKLLARVMRTHAVLARVDAARAAYPRAVDWSAIAYEMGYYDQPHFIDDFKSLTGSTPGEWAQSKPISDEVRD